MQFYFWEYIYSISGTVCSKSCSPSVLFLILPSKLRYFSRSKSCFFISISLSSLSNPLSLFALFQILFLYIHLPQFSPSSSLSLPCVPCTKSCFFTSISLNSLPHPLSLCPVFLVPNPVSFYPYPLVLFLTLSCFFTSISLNSLPHPLSLYPLLLVPNPVSLYPSPLHYFYSSSSLSLPCVACS